MDFGLKQEKDLRELFEVESGAFASGLFASVKRARSRRTGQLFAAKHSPKRKENYNEVRLLSKLISPYIISFKDAFETSTHVVVIMEFAPGGDMQSLIDADVVLNEGHAARYTHQLLQGLAYLHSKSIAHLDIKPQNLLLMGDFPHRDSIIKICDFELSRVIHPHVEVREIVGTPDYVAPEILQYEPLSLKADIWSTAIVVYVLLTGFSPFGGETDTETFNNIIHNEIDFPAEIFYDVVSHAGIEFISWLCQKNVHSRPTAAAALQHVWLKSSRLSSRKKGMSKSSYDLTKGRMAEKTRLRKSKSREQLWRSKIHLSLSSEKIERWASVASFSHGHTPLLAAAGREKMNRSVRVHSEESLMTMILPTPAIVDPAVKALIDSELEGDKHALLPPIPPLSNGNSSNHHRNGTVHTNGSNGSGFRPEPPPRPTHEKNGLNLLPPTHLEELTPGEKIKETVDEEEVQKSVAELISKFGGTHKTKKHGKGGGSSTATNSSINLDPIEELDDQENNDNSLTGVVDQTQAQQQQQQGRHGLRKSVASNSSESSSSGSRSSSTTTIDDIKATLAQLLPITIVAPPNIPVLPPIKSSYENRTDSKVMTMEPSQEHEKDKNLTVLTNERELTSPVQAAQVQESEVTQVQQRSPNPNPETSSTSASNGNGPQRRISTSFYVPLKGNSNNNPVTQVSFPRTRRKPSTTPKISTNANMVSSSPSPRSSITTGTTTPISSVATITVNTGSRAKKPTTNRFTSRYEMRIGDKSSSSNNNSTNLPSSTAVTTTSASSTRPTGRTSSATGPTLSSAMRARSRLTK